MKTMKKFFKYLLLFIALYVVVTLLTKLGTLDIARKFRNYEILTDSPQITVKSCEVAKNYGNISVEITNNQDYIINTTYLKIEAFDKDNVSIGSKYQEIHYFYPNEKCSYSIDINWRNIDKLELSFVERIPQTKISELKIDSGLATIATLLVLINL